MPAVGNVATVMCFAICLILNVNLTGGSNRAIFFLAPILLLLNQDSDFIAGFGDKQRYFPVTVVISAYLVLTGLYSIWEDVWHGNAGWGFGNWRSRLVLCGEEFGSPRAYIPEPYPFQQVYVEFHKTGGLNAIDNYAP